MTCYGNHDAGRTNRQARWIGIGLVLVLLVGAWFRLAGIGWDEGTHLHPDERFLTDVESLLRPTFSIAEYFSTATSPLNPHNWGKGFFVYGTLPIFVVRYAAEALNAICQSSAGCTTNYVGYDGVYLVGRALSALADLGVVLVIYGIGCRLYNRRAALVAAALGALAVLPIQQAHFFTVDTFLTLFVALAFYFAVRVAQGGDRGHWALFGVSLGMALACKISVWPMGLVLVAAVLIRVLGDREKDLLGPLVGLAAAALIAFATFRVFQPYAFAGPNYSRETLGEERFTAALVAAPPWWGTLYDVLPEPIRAVLLPSAEWLGNMRSIQDQMTGNVDFPPNHQWTDRKPIIFPWRNMVLYGMGPFLGLTAWAGWLGAVIQMVGRKKRALAWQRHLLPVLWVTIFFLYQGTQWVKSMRYLLPVYPVLILLAAWLLVALWDRAGRSSARESEGRGITVDFSGLWIFLGRHWKQGMAGGLLLGVVLGTFLWAWSFSNIYRETFTRVAASRWVYENVPTGATLLYQGPGGPAELNLAVPIFTYSADGARQVTRFQMPEDGTLVGVRMNYLSDPALDKEQEVLRVAVAADVNSVSELASAERGLDLQHATHVRGSDYLFNLAPAVLAEGGEYYLITEVLSGAPVHSTGAFVVNESSWDDGLPWRVDGLDGFSMYEGAPLELYWEDNPDKRDRMIELLDTGEYLFISSTRQLGSITRLPPRYPLTIAYYEMLFDGRLGYELVASFQADIRVGPLVINDVFGRLGWGEAPEVGWPPPDEWAAEEAFSVYDHPPVWIFIKSADYSPSETRALLEAVDISRQRFVNPFEYTQELKAARRPWFLEWLGPAEPDLPEIAPAESRSMFLPEKVLAEQRAGGTWRELFDPEGLLSQQHWLGAAVWWLLVVLLGWLAFPLAMLAMGGLPSRGYAASKILALLLVSWFAWLAGSLDLLPYTRGTVWLAMGLLALLGLAAAWWQRRQLIQFVQGHWRLILVVEGVAVLLFVIFVLIRSGNPDLWHPSKGGEKPLNFAFFNAVMKSSSFPPYDPWLAGGYLNYYYYGYVLVGSITKALGIVPYVAYNLALPMLFSLTGLGAFSVSFDLVAGVWRCKSRTSLPLGGEESSSWMKKAIWGGLAAVLVVVLLGNLGQPFVIVNGWHRLGQLHSDPSSGALAQTLIGLVRNLQGEALPLYTGSWYWDATRIIPPGEGEAGPIAEFPFFTFLYADLHAHMMDMPLVLLALAWALGMVQAADRRRLDGTATGSKRWLGLLLTWAVGALAIGALRATNTWDWPTMLGVGVVAVVYAAWRSIGRGWRWVVAAGMGVGGLVGLNTLFFLPYTEHFVMAYTEIHRWEGGITPIWAYLAVHGLFLFVLLGWLGREFVDWTRHLTSEGLEALEPWGAWIGVGVLLVLGLMVGLLAMGVPVGPLIVLAMVPSGLLALQPRLPAERRAVLMLLTLGLALTLAVELVVFSGDISRMNTVFKFYNQVWLIFSAVGGAALVWLRESVRRWRPLSRRVWLATLAVLVFCAALYPPTAARAKIRDRFHADQPPAGLDGMVYMRTAIYHDQDQAMSLEYDYQGIRWLQDHVDGSPVIMEASIPEYRWGSRISINTGLPAVVGWNWHTRQHRAGFVDASEEVFRRVGEVTLFYDTGDTELAMEILRRYDVRFVIAGPLERAYYDPAGIEKLDLMAEQGFLQEVYRSPGLVIYQVAG